MIFGKKRKPADISVELKIIGFMSGEYVNIIGQVSVPDECTLARLLKEAGSSGSIPRSLYRFLARPPSAISILVNGRPLQPEERRDVRLHGGDGVSFLSVSTGG